MVEILVVSVLTGGSWLSLLKYWTARFTGCDGRLAWLLCEYIKPSQDSLQTCKYTYRDHAVPTDPTPEAPKRGNKHPHDDDDEITEVPGKDKPAEPPKKKKKKKKNKDSKEAVPTWEGEDDGTRPSTSMVEPEDVADEATLVPAPTEVPAEEIKAPKKKKQKKKDAKLEKFRLEQ